MKRKTKVILIPAVVIAILLVVGVAVFLKARAESWRNACINNLRMLTAPMICCVPMAWRLTDGDELDPKKVCQYIKGSTMPICPADGTYDVTWIVGGPTPKCSVHGDVFWDLYQVRTLTELDKKQKERKKAQQPE